MKNRPFAEDKWNGFGGKFKGDQTFTQNALRELGEEVNILLPEEELC